ncbi:MAG: efflux RND transporter permease subunit [Gammaproteobacteria bacterium]|nr:efflux RND transporter permease subunit [Gammaproteobacteria bacterium]
MNIIQFSIRNALVVNLFLLIIVIAGAMAWTNLPQEMFPVVDLDRVRIVTEFEGAPPAEVEKQITRVIEEELESLPDIDLVTSESSEGLSKIEIQLKTDTDVDDFLLEVRALVDAINDLPDEAETPVVNRLKTRFPVISLALYGDIPPGLLYATAEDVRRDILSLPGVASVGIAGDREWELWVVVDPQRLAVRGVSLEQVQQALRANLRDLPGGSVQSAEGDILLRGMGVADDVEAVERLVLQSEVGGGQLMLSEVAEVQLRLQEEQTLGRFNGAPSVNLTITKTAKASTIDIAAAVRVYQKEIAQSLPPGIEVGLFSDLSSYVKTRLDTVKSSGLIGLILVLASLYWFLNFRVAFITALGIPVSFLIGVMLMYYLGYTINMISLFAFLIALGMIVDDAIIVTENVYRHIENGVAPRQAARVGAAEVFWPIVASTSTTIAAFMPMFGITGTMGKFIEVIPVVVTVTLIGSLIEAFVILPAHAADYLRLKKKKKSEFWSKGLKRYLSVLQWSLLNRYIISVATIAILAVFLTYAATRLPYNQFGSVETGQFMVNIEAPNTYSLDDSAGLAETIEGRILASMDEEQELKSMLTNVGVTLIDFNRLKMGSHYIQIIIDLEKAAPKGFIENYVSPVVNLKFSTEGTRERSTQEVINQIRLQLQDIAGVQRFSILRPQGGPAGSDIEIGVSGDNIDRLIQLSTEVKQFLRQLPGVQDVQQDLEPGKLEYQYSLNERGRELGLTQQQISNAVRTGYVGLELEHVSWDNERYPVRLIYPDHLRKDGSTLANLPIILSGGGTVYLGEVADITLSRGLGTILRRDAQRLALVTAEVDTKVTTPIEVNALIERQFSDAFDNDPNYELLFLGEKKEANDSFKDVFNVLIISLAVIFFILAALFKSILDPLVIMLAIPFGIVGVIIGHMLFNYNLQFLSMIGFLALTGIVVNDSLILVDFAKKRRVQGIACVEALIDAGRTRIRPILLTTVTTFLGISPLIFFASGQTAFLSPMAISLGFGLIFATVLILIVVPCFYMVADDFRSFLQRLRASQFKFKQDEPEN